MRPGPGLPGPHARRSGPSRPARRCRQAHAVQLQSHLHAGQHRQQREVVAVAQVPHAEHPAPHLAEARAEREVEALVDQPAQRVRVHALGHDHAGEHRRVQARFGALGGQAPGRHGGAHAGGPALVARENVRQALVEQHVERLAQAVQQVRVGRVGPVAVRVHRDDLVPGPERARQLRVLRSLHRARRQRVEADARRQHQALLRAADRHVHAPFVVPVVGAGEARDRVHHQQRRMLRGVDRAPHRRRCRR